MSWPEKDRIFSGVMNMLQLNMGFREGEKLLVLNDVPRPQDWLDLDLSFLEDMLKRTILARLVSEIAAEQFPGSQVELLPYPASGGHGTEIDKAAAARMRQVDVVLAITSYSMTHTNARSEAAKSGARVASMPAFDVAMFAPDGPLAVDARQVSADCQKFADLLTGARQATVQTAAGTHLTFILNGRNGKVDDGLYREPGRWGNLPGGEAYAVPLEGTGQGELVVQAGWYPNLVEDMILRFEGGLVVDQEGGGKVGEEFRQSLNLESDSSTFLARRNLAELGIGCNPKARKPDNVLEAEKIKGTVHIAIGDNLHMGGQVEADLHEDFVQPWPDLILNGHYVIKDGEWVF